MSGMFGLPGIDDVLSMTEEQKELYDREVMERIAAHEAREKNERFRRCGIGERFFCESFETFIARNEETKAAKEIVLNYVKDIQQGKFKTLKMLGAVGNGKTHLAAAILKEFGGTYRKAAEIVSEYQASKSFSANLREKDLLDIYGRSKLLVIDEIGRSNSEKDEKYMLYAILNARYELRKPSVLISNFSNKDFAAFTGEAVTDRLNEQAITIEFKSNSYRLEKRDV